MTPRVKVHEDDRIAMAWVTSPEGRTWLATGGDGEVGNILNDETVSGPGWRDAAVVRLSGPVEFDGDARTYAGGVIAEDGVISVWATKLAPDGARQLASSLLSAAAWAERRADVAERNAALREALAEDAAHLTEVEASVEPPVRGA